MKILIVEDAPAIRENLKKFISDIKDFKVSGEAEDSSTAIKLINETNPDIIILDVELKTGTGFDVLKFVKGKSYKNNPVVIMFSNYIKTYSDKAEKYKADYIFDKTNEIDKLLSTLNDLQQKLQD